MTEIQQRRHGWYLDRLIRQGRSPRSVRRDPTKRADWAKFCCVCGADIRELPRNVRVCGEACAAIRKERRAYSSELQEKWVRQNWRRRIRAAVKGWAK